MTNVAGRIWKRPFLGLALLGLLSVAACEEEPEPETPAPEEDEVTSALSAPEGMGLSAADFADLPGWQDDDVAAALPALVRSCNRFMGQPEDRTIGPNGYGGQVADWRPGCTALSGLESDAPAARVRRVLETHFTPLAVSGESGHEGLFTGYYEATLQAARRRHGPYQHPLYAPPGDLITANLGDFRADLDVKRIIGRIEGQKLVPYYDREAIANGALAGRDLALLWADDPVDVFFLHVQGSGMARLPDGSNQRVGYAASNGRSFTAIGRELIDSGALDGADMSMQAIRDWLRANPEKADALMQRNARYIFFREIEGEGPIGAFGVPLTPRRSLAVDPDKLPLGAPVWLATTQPASEEPLRRLMVAQDTGSAIQGAVRGDFFWGHGEPALAKAGRMKQRGRYWVFLPRRALDRMMPAS